MSNTLPVSSVVLILFTEKYLGNSAGKAPILPNVHRYKTFDYEWSYHYKENSGKLIFKNVGLEQTQGDRNEGPHIISENTLTLRA